MSLVERLLQIYENDWRVAHIAHTSDTAKEAADEIDRLTARVAEREARNEALDKSVMVIAERCASLRPRLEVATGALRKEAERYESQAKFADPDYAVHFRDFARFLREALRQIGGSEHILPTVGSQVAVIAGEYTGAIGVVADTDKRHDQVRVEFPDGKPVVWCWFFRKEVVLAAPSAPADLLEGLRDVLSYAGSPLPLTIEQRARALLAKYGAR